ncbi:wiskott-Aldrich syndrome protein family member 3-like isoform X2 [Falco naumanni]|uniref:wiskott-Aldrich syndrome protein family member 3-like isoform X2 n=1 Tax=Falco naumanni TaxID=148594 RepID=UPI001ADE0B83|nr:wiskott-Aldrich syndrome protein family member 3-like isoform X2 [Falco naumanni]XP_055583737.1 actin-binding protein WASF3-like isoform X2 [Falco cherrug]XP_055674334.1 actin-binding protein WASF3-like isoform X2 [Falco peregrinus]
MPLVKRNIEPRHLCRGALPEGVTSELECVTNSTLAAIIKQLGSLSRHAEDIFGELFNEANSFYMRMNSLQERVDLLVIKVTQLDSTVEEVSLQDINMRKAFKSSTVQNQQVVSRNSIPNPVMEMYQRCDKPPPLNILTPYRDDKKDGLKFYTDPSYFFNLWKEKMLQATEDKRKEKRRQKEQRLVEDSTREVKKVRKARNRRLEWNMMAYDKEFRPDNRSYASDAADHSYPASPNHPAQLLAPASHLAPAEHKEGVLAAAPPQEHVYRPAAGSRQNSLNRLQQPHVPQPPEAILNGPRPHLVKDYGPQPVPMAEYFVPPAPPPPPPVIPSAQTAFDSPISAPPALAPGSAAPTSYAPSPPPAPPGPYSASPPQAGPMGPPVAPPPPPPGPPAVAASPAHSASPPAPAVEPRKAQIPLMPMSDARSDLLAAIRRGIQLRKVQEQWEQEAKKEPVGNDVATILSRRIAVEYSESDDDSELDDNEWSD